MNKRNTQRFRKALGALIKEARLAANMTQKELAYALRIKISVLQRYEYGKCSMNWIRFIDICRMLDMDAGEELTTILQKVGR